MDIVRYRGVLALATFIALVIGCTNGSAEDVWVRTCPEEQFCFQRPPDMVEVPVQAIDSLTGVYRSTTLELVYDLGLYGMDFTQMINPSIESLTVDSRVGEILTTTNIMALRVMNVRKDQHFAMIITSSTAAIDSVVARRILTSVEFVAQ